MKINLLWAPMLLVASSAQAGIELGFGLAAQSGSRVEVPIVVSGLVDVSAPSLAAYDLDIGSDSRRLAFSSVSFGNQLDVFGLGINPAAAESVGPVPGLLNLYELSLDSGNDLDAFQADSFTLATLAFNVLQPGSSDLTMVANALSDAHGESLPGVSVQTSATVTTVPIPPAAWLMLSGLGFGVRQPLIPKTRLRTGFKPAFDRVYRN
ncbi:cohesin domain-containing protein [Methylomonas sp. DH-1]|uniref:cohesin domain-containing protein n=1 Tax=Methylomonas sp. (strain DH-1) TaxID=1727196 RepID=UPI0012F6DE5C|nr:cohesin domain-containing protein [Methylomonas sp. DH-1]